MTLADTAARLAVAGITQRRSRRSSSLLGVVLLYHDVAEVAGDPDRHVVPAIGVEVLRAHFNHLRRRYDVVSIHELRRRIACRAPGDRIPVALTFDDDLQSHRRFVAPLLTEFGFPGTFFLTGSSLDEPHAFWWQDLNDLFTRAGEYWLEVSRDVGRRWGSVAGAVDLRLLAQTLERLSPDARDSLAHRLRELVASPPRDQGLSASDLAEMAAAGLEIGFHTKSHYHLQVVDDETLHRELRERVDRVSAAAGDRLRAIAYPYGGGDLRVAGAAAAAGFELGFLWTNRPVSAHAHPLLVDRIDCSQSPPDEFAFRLARILAGSS